MEATLLIKNIKELATNTGTKAKKGKAMSDVKTYNDVAILVNQNKIIWIGDNNQIPEVNNDNLKIIDACNNSVVPGFIDSHTHFVFSGYRADEFFWRASGVSYMDIHKNGGGISNTVNATRNASFDELYNIAFSRLQKMLIMGITTVEGKSGYGLDLETEIKQLEVMKKLNQNQAIDIVPTFMGLHSIPSEYKNNSQAYIDFVIEKVLPIVKEKQLAKFCDVFCEDGVFSVSESQEFLQKAKELGFKLKIHAEEIKHFGGAILASTLGATSADHLLKATEQDILSMTEQNVIATCLPLTAFILQEPYANARMFIDKGIALAIASDLNPGSCYSQSIPLAISLCVLNMKMSIEETLTAITLNAAAALDLADKTGSIEIGKQADILILDAPSYKHLAYNSAMNIVKHVIKSGQQVL